MGKFNTITAFLAGFAAVTAFRAAKNNMNEMAAIAAGSDFEREQILMQGNERDLYEDWKKYGPRWENGYFVPDQI